MNEKKINREFINSQKSLSKVMVLKHGTSQNPKTKLN